MIWVKTFGINLRILLDHRKEHMKFIFKCFTGITIGGAAAQGQQGQPGQGQGQGQGSQFNSPCLQMFDQNFRKCFKDNGNFELEVIFSLVTNGSSGPLPQGTSRQQLMPVVCGYVQ